MCRTKCQFAPWEVCLRETGEYVGSCDGCKLKEGN